MLSGLPPFYHKDQYTMFKNILEKPLPMKSNFSPHTISLLKGLLSVEVVDPIKFYLIINFKPSRRLGYSERDSLEIKSHPFFKKIDWELLRQKKLVSPLKLKVSGPLDLRHFDKCFTNEHIKETFDHDSNIDPNFAGFTYIKRFFFGFS